jgi:hypothetical protein
MRQRLLAKLLPRTIRRRVRTKAILPVPSPHLDFRLMSYLHQPNLAAQKLQARVHLLLLACPSTLRRLLLIRSATMADRPTIAQAIFPHLPSTDPRVVRERRRVDDWRQQQRNLLLESLREVNRKIDARLGRERRS